MNLIIDNKNNNNNNMSVKECMLLFDNLDLKEKLNNACEIMVHNLRFNQYLRDSIVPYNGSISSLEQLRNQDYFTLNEQRTMIEGFSLIKGLLFVKYGGINNGFLLLEISSDNDSRIQLLYFSSDKTIEQSKEINLQYISQYYNYSIIDDNWYLCVSSNEQNSLTMQE